ncbi:conserved hypothetical protein [uncultured Desulfobacterium sp.]|uniref:Uncharacterized protein n=1 Tax=uncultured Desulfobacterium sp. TaxID=201089 RepID=A0A445MWF2_9BACT|nr:conserved hypothetical protein [uncultured Desulfobacterium sp.]
MEERFLKFVDNLLKIEGGYNNDTEDRGGETKYGISRRSYPTLDIKALTREKAVEIYYQDFWRMYHYDQITDDRIAEKVFSFCVNMGPMEAHVLLQTALVSSGVQVAIDGHLGPKSIEAVNSHPNPAWLLAEYKIAVVNYYLSLNQPRFIGGWVRRAVA